MHNRSWPCPGTSAGTLHHQTRPKYSYSEGGASAEGKRSPQPLPSGNWRCSFMGMFLEKLNQGSLRAKRFCACYNQCLENWVLFPHPSLCLLDMNTQGALDAIQLIQETSVPSSQTADRSFVVSVLASLGVHSEVRIAPLGNSQDIYMCDMTWGMLETTYPGYFQTRGCCAEDEQNGSCKDCINEHGFLLSSSFWQSHLQHQVFKESIWSVLLEYKYIQRKTLHSLQSNSWRLSPQHQDKFWKKNWLGSAVDIRPKTSSSDLWISKSSISTVLLLSASSCLSWSSTPMWWYTARAAVECKSPERWIC